jgi:hypothetical protein
LLQQQLKEYSENISSLQLDIHCLQEFIWPSSNHIFDLTYSYQL